MAIQATKAHAKKAQARICQTMGFYVWELYAKKKMAKDTVPKKRPYVYICFLGDEAFLNQEPSNISLN